PATTTPVPTTPPDTNTLLQLLPANWQDALVGEKAQLFARVGIDLGIMAAITTGTWFATGLVKKVASHLTQRSDLSDREKYRVEAAIATARMLLVGGIFTASSVVVGDSAMLATVNLLVGAAVAGFFLQETITSLYAYAILSNKQQYPLGSFIKVGGMRGFVLARNLTHTTLIDFVEKAKVKPGEANPDERLDFEDDPTVSIPINVLHLLDGKQPIISVFPNNSLLGCVEVVPQRHLNQKQLDHFLSLLSPDRKTPKASSTVRAQPAKLRPHEQTRVVLIIDPNHPW
ncbi:MAG TPA: hypothetical protein VJC18_02890, partial [bacterium]|nr:hypothetical protein [bacterium]